MQYANAEHVLLGEDEAMKGGGLGIERWEWGLGALVAVCFPHAAFLQAVAMVLQLPPNSSGREQPPPLITWLALYRPASCHVLHGQRPAGNWPLRGAQA